MRNSTISKIRQNYNLRAAIPFDGETYKKTVIKDVNLLSQFITPASSLLDVGCGSGWHLEHLYKAGYSNLTGIDISELALRNFRQRFNTDNINLFNIDFFNYIAPQKFDCIINFHSCLGQFGISKDRIFINRCFENLKNQGHLILSIFTKNNIYKIIGIIKARYSNNSDIIVHSVTTYDNENNILKIMQSFSGITLEERISVYDEKEIIFFLSENTFQTIDIIQGHSDYCSVFVCQK